MSKKSLRKILFLDDGVPEKFFKDLEFAAKSSGIALQRINPKKLMIQWSEDRKMKFFTDNAEIDIDNSFLLPRRTSKVARPIIGLLFLYARLNGISGDDAWRETYVRVNKCWHLMMLSQHEIPYVESFICTTESFKNNFKTILSNVAFPVVVKGEGGKGQAVWKVNSVAELKKLCQSIDTPFLIQKYIENLFDIRICIYRNEVLWTIKRSSIDGFYNNISKGGNREQIEISEEEKRLALKAAAVMRMDLAGVDLVRTAQGPYIFEVNASPGLDETSDFLNLDVGKVVINKLLANKLLDRK